MARRRSTVPPYLRHSSGKARIRTYNASGKRIEIILPGEYGSVQSKAEYARIIAQLAANKCYTPRSVNRAIARGCKRAKVAPWHTHQLRHSAALNILREFGPEAARSTLGHRTLNMTLHYAGIDLEIAKNAAKKIG